MTNVAKTADALAGKREGPGWEKSYSGLSLLLERRGATYVAASWFASAQSGGSREVFRVVIENLAVAHDEVIHCPAVLLPGDTQYPFTNAWV